ncbi:ABC transporter ATP-binding protein [Amycolatopsis sp. FDAARGOS 1241]|uniref:ATP-binding cassette domain-containing protein n=1 Tax=Amycolatopsis sp. FDAARGOS 1241 TaxID=2778070 RepID=UPI00194E7821|nr:ABC transporter ATP-binding protein [Amycolatopsis sp. FDAARGOS 1241]QRP48885.1 ABC transporter ATP-binding protein [Amycolatopsis sp. FDAARGOS 1241]
MQVRADRVSLEGPHGTLLPPTSLAVEDGCVTLVHGEPGVGITALALALAGRVKPSTGTVTADVPGLLRDLVAVVDAPGVSEPDEALALRVVAGEELALAHRPAGKDDVLRWLTEHDAAPFAGTRFENLEPALRTRLLAELAAERTGVRVLVLDTPDRHTSHVESWTAVAEDHAKRGLAVAVLTATTPAAALPHPPARIGSTDQPGPVRLLAGPEESSAEENGAEEPRAEELSAEGDPA